MDRPHGVSVTGGNNCNQLAVVSHRRNDPVSGAAGHHAAGTSSATGTDGTARYEATRHWGDYPACLRAMFPAVSDYDYVMSDKLQFVASFSR